MLLRFSLSNFRSVFDEQELSLIATSLKGISDPLFFKREINEAVLPVAAIYGPNASGKTNVLRSLHFFRSAVQFSQRRWEPNGGIPRSPFMFSNGASEPSRFEIDVLISGTRYQYGFVVNSSEVLDEWVYAYPTGKKQIWMERSGSSFEFGRNLTGENKSIQNLTRKNSLFLSAAAQNNHEMLLPLYTWFATHLHFVRGSREVMETGTAKLCADPKRKAAIESLLAKADLGVTGFNVEHAEIEAEVKKVVEGLKTLIPNSKFDLPNEIDKVFLSHGSASGENVVLPLDEESNGTIAYFGLLGPVMRALDTGGALCIDELDSSLHPLLAMEVVKIFNTPESNPRGAQLIFNTHDTNLLDQRVLRRDQVWFTEKDDNGGTHLYPLSDFTTRTQENIENGYLQGRYGAVPFLGASEFMKDYFAAKV